jgi:ribosomal protein S18 acetylase RimI-like enzyme
VIRFSAVTHRRFSILTEKGQFAISVAEPNERELLIQILEESFEGIYLRHSKRTLRDSELVKVAWLNSERVGLVILKDLGKKSGYVYYIAVRRHFRGQGVAGKLLDDALEHFFKKGMEEVYASVEEDNEESKRLFASRGFEETGYERLSKKYGRVSAALLYGKMWVVPGEKLLHKELSQKIG